MIGALHNDTLGFTVIAHILVAPAWEENRIMGVFDNDRALLLPNGCTMKHWHAPNVCAPEDDLPMVPIFLCGCTVTTHGHKPSICHNQPIGQCQRCSVSICQSCTGKFDTETGAPYLCVTCLAFGGE